MNNYIGHPHQLSGVEEVTLARGKGKGMTLLDIRNGRGLRLTLSPDRALDIARVEHGGVNVGYFAPCGYVAPAYYDNKGAGFLKSFTAGFLTTCGIRAVGSPCTDQGEELPLHGNIANTPCEHFSYEENEAEITVHGEIRDAAIFGTSYLMVREYRISKTENRFSLRDTVENIGGGVAPCMLLYHINFGYPILNEDAEVFIPAAHVTPRDAHAGRYTDTCLQMEVPQRGYQERCYYHDVKATDGRAAVGIYSKAPGRGVKIAYDKRSLGCFTEWKMMGEREYVLGLEPGNCTPDGRDVLRKKGTLIELAPGEAYHTELEFHFSENREDIVCL